MVKCPAMVEREIKMSEHTELPWYVDDSVDIRKCPDSFIATCNGHCNGRTLSFAQDEANAELIVRACNTFADIEEGISMIVRKDHYYQLEAQAKNQPDLLEACNNAVQRMEDSPVQACGEWQTGLFCGLEDRNITDRYDACMHGYEKALERVQEWIIDEIEAAINKAKP